MQPDKSLQVGYILYSQFRTHKNRTSAMNVHRSLLATRSPGTEVDVSLSLQLWQNPEKI
jgi:hypothetical protein